ncbi:F-box only protein 40 isoform X2 [Gouania willdenowi]|uniref:F-box only protein 40 isoform X2 n=1 Tax=Gouania willdenowi TaxID=441366 RepID=UPI001055B15B|nr:F-box only protein 40 isoform X2 [Gouania willdenowi]
MQDRGSPGPALGPIGQRQSVKTTNMSEDEHKHCGTCYDIHCSVPAQSSVSCLIIICSNNCGAAFHACKEEEHQLLCPNESVPCLNIDNGCPLSMLRHMLAKHLKVCPASVVCCSHEWNRWPITETDHSFNKNISQSLALSNERDLDVALALRDQDLLFHSIKMKNIFPELILEESQPFSRVSSHEVLNSLDCEKQQSISHLDVDLHEEVMSREERDKTVTSRNMTGLQFYSTFERIFNQEKDGCEQTVKNLNKKENGEKRHEHDSQCRGGKSEASVENAAGSSYFDGATGFAPWQDGVLERLGKEVHIAEYNMYLAHNGLMLINFGQLSACTPREKDFVYGNLEPIEVKTVRTFHVPTSYRAKRSFLKDAACKAQMLNQSVDTTDLGLSLEDLPKSEEISTALLCSMEKELKGHLISQSTSVDGVYIDIGTQTYNFTSASFKPEATLSDIMAEKPPGLYVHVEEESVTRRHNRTCSAFSYMCGQHFRRDEFPSHFRNVHSDIQASLCGWFQQRCPLAYLGCTFTQARFRPAGHLATIKFCKDVNTFILQPQVMTPLPCGGEKPVGSQREGFYDPDPLSELPLEILRLIIDYLDSFALSQLSQVSHLMRQVCATLLQQRGMVSLKWEKKTCPDGRISWECPQKVWKFSSVFSTVDRWSFSSAPSMSDHLKSCVFYQRKGRRDPVALVGLGEVTGVQGKGNLKRC